MSKKFWEVSYNDFMPEVNIKFKKMLSLDVLDLADRNVSGEGNTKQFKLDCLRNVVWSKGGEYFPLMDEVGNITLEGISNSSVLDIFYTFRREVLLPVFTESRTYQTLLETESEKITGQDEKRE